MSLRIAGDYAVLRVGRDRQTLSCYYGHEEVDEHDEWCFVAEHGPDWRLVYTQAELQLSDRWDCPTGLLRGIELLLTQGHLIPAEGMTGGE